MSVEEDNRQEWTFTLYDFDNNGKVTREVNFVVRSEKRIKKNSTKKDQSHTSIKASEQYSDKNSLSCLCIENVVLYSCFCAYNVTSKFNDHISIT